MSPRGQRLGELEGEGISAATDRDHVQQWGCLTPTEGVAEEKRRTQEKGGKEQESKRPSWDSSTQGKGKKDFEMRAASIRRLRDALYTCGLRQRTSPFVF